MSCGAFPPVRLSRSSPRCAVPAGILPIKMKLMLIADSPRWMSIMMGIFSRFMSKKMQKRMVVVKGDAEAWATVASSVGGKQYCPPGFGEMGGTAPDPVAAKYGIK